MRAALLALAACGAPGAIRAVPANELAWRAVGTTGLFSVDVWGDAAGGAHGTLTRMPAGLAEPLHVHSREFRVVVVAGTLRYTIAGRATAALGPGSYVAIPAGIPHLAACIGPEPCEVYVEQDGALDVQPIVVQSASGPGAS